MMHSLCFHLIGSVFILPWLLKSIFTGNRILGWQLLSFLFITWPDLYHFCRYGSYLSSSCFFEGVCLFFLNALKMPPFVFHQFYSVGPRCGVFKFVCFDPARHASDLGTFSHYVFTASDPFLHPLLGLRKWQHCPPQLLRPEASGPSLTPPHIQSVGRPCPAVFPVLCEICPLLFLSTDHTQIQITRLGGASAWASWICPLPQPRLMPFFLHSRHRSHL